jgi:hypothetical protein
MPFRPIRFGSSLWQFKQYLIYEQYILFVICAQLRACTVVAVRISGAYSLPSLAAARDALLFGASAVRRRRLFLPAFRAPARPDGLVHIRMRCAPPPRRSASCGASARLPSWGTRNRRRPTPSIWPCAYQKDVSDLTVSSTHSSSFLWYSATKSTSSCTSFRSMRMTWKRLKDRRGS